MTATTAAGSDRFRLRRRRTGRPAAREENVVMALG